MRLRVAIATTGRFHVLDLARELEDLGHSVAFWTTVPKWRTNRFGLSRGAHRSMLPALLPLVVSHRYATGRLKALAARAEVLAADRFVSHRLQPCDIFIGMSGIAVSSAQAARERYGARVFLERGSVHVRLQNAILRSLCARGFSADVVPDYMLQRELLGYKLADRVVVPSRLAEESFVANGYPPARLFRNPYGVDLGMFPITPAPKVTAPSLLFVGAWSYQKGADVLCAAMRELGDAKLVHVGSFQDAPIPSEKWFRHVDPVPQWRLTGYYGEASVFVLPSRQEGLALVQAQALASGVPIVCTDRTGGADLKAILSDGDWVTVVPADNASALARGMREMLAKSAMLRGARDLFGEARGELSWRSYGQRYSAELLRVMSESAGK